MCLLAKLFALLMDERLREQTSLNNRQLGFRKGVGTREAIAALAGLVASSKARKLPLLAAFVDFSKAFDKVPRVEGEASPAEALSESFRRASEPPKPSAEKCIYILLKGAKPTSQGVSEMASGPDGYGMAWLSLAAIKKAFEELAEAVEEGRLEYLTTLNLRNSGLDEERLQLLSSAAFAADRGFSLETLILGGATFRKKETFFKLVRRVTMPRLKVLCLGNSVLSPTALKGLAEGLLEGWTMYLECLDLEGVCLESPKDEDDEEKVTREESIGALAGALKDFYVFNLKTFKMGPYLQDKGMESVLSALNSDDAPQRLQNVHLNLLFCGMDEDRAKQCLHASLQLSSLRSLDVKMGVTHAVSFLQGLMNSSKTPPWESLSLTVEEEALFQLASKGVIDFTLFATEILRAIADALDAGCLACLRKLSLCYMEFLPTSSPKVALFLDSLSTAKLPHLRDLEFSLIDNGFDGYLSALGRGVKKGNFPNLKALHLRSVPVWKEGMTGFFGNLMDSENGLPCLEKVEFNNTGAPEGMEVFVEALLAGKMPNLSEICVIHDYLGNEDGLMMMQGLGEAVKGGALCRNCTSKG
uniref:Reverse transcriptase domain-containing protein n=1 Tax=Chromera velia CCMP2878 TaxID=1169474 RepID=A0A0G4HY43_9ALVE|eukprot:Cvel_9410.t1-p1 / transcript=Cvel_9410.t1 / gene=Cvel_9410 / organism=Chromera_velia_CCMP2878 / gene_product=hypothetical protein / transcript_product=hypothetical protein / location=Cvel_scaffold541:30268-42857(+) / protein_length=585 / sequence_SO=supercontig / SO=protein_coding / is_pseudo=false